jgi:uncharacterized membrane protein
VREMAAKPVPRTEAAIGGVLRIGVAVSLLVIAAGTLRSFVQDGGYGNLASDVPRLTGPAGAFPRTASWLLGGLRALDGQAVIVAGLLLLIATPVLRVGVSIVVFGRERDRPYMAIASAVLMLLLLSFALGYSA